MKILLVEDEISIAEPLEQILKKNKFSVDLAFNGEEGLDFGLSNIYDVILLDIMLPKMNGLEVLQILRENGIKTPVLMLTAKGQIEDKIMGLDRGADDYLPKPFDKKELLARVRALSRRSSEIYHQSILKIGNVELDTESFQLSCKEHVNKLPLKEAQLLELLIKNKNRVISKDFIIEKLWGYDSDADRSNVEYHISFIRKKLKHMKANIIIDTIRGCGYCLKVESDE